MVLNDALEKLQAIFRILIGQSAEAEWFREKSKSDFVSDSDWVVHLLKIHKCHCCHGCIETSLSTTAHQTDANIVIANRTESQSNKADHPISSNAINFRSHVPPQSVLDSHETDKIPPSTPNSEPVKRRIISTSESDDVSLKKKSKRKRRSPCHLPRDDEGEERDQISMDSASPACSVEDNMAPEEDCHQMSRSVRDDAGAAVYMDVATDTTALQASSLQDKHENVKGARNSANNQRRYREGRCAVPQWRLGEVKRVQLYYKPKLVVTAKTAAEHREKGHLAMRKTRAKKMIQMNEDLAVDAIREYQQTTDIRPQSPVNIHVSQTKSSSADSSTPRDNTLSPLYGRNEEYTTPSAPHHRLVESASLTSSLHPDMKNSNLISIKEEQVDEDGRYGNMPGMVSDGSGTDPVVRVKMEPETDYESFNIHESRYLNVNNDAPYVTNINYIAPLSNKEEPQFQCFQVPTCETEMTSRTSNIDTFSGRTAVLQDPQPQSSIQSQSLPLGHDFQAAMRLQAMASQSVSDSLPNKISQSFHLQDYQAVSHLSAHEQLQRLRSQDPSPFNQTNYDELIKSLLQSSVSVPNSQQISPDIQAPPLAEHETRLSRRLKDRQKIEMYSLHESDSVPEKSMKSHSLLRSMLFPKVQVSSPATTAHQYRASSARAQLVSLLQMQNTRQSSHEMPLHIDMDQDSQSLSQSSTGHSPHNPSSDSSMLKTLLHERDLVATMHDQSSQHGLSAYEARMQFRKKGVGMKSDKHVTEAALEGAKIDDVKSSPLADLLNSATCSVNDMLIQKLANKLPVSHTIVNESVKSSSNPTLPIDNTSRSYEDGQIGNISSLLEVSLPYSFNSRTGHDEDSATKTPVLSSLLSLRTTTTSDAAASSSRYMEELLRDRRLSPTHSTRIMSTSADPDPDCSIIPYPEDFTSTPVTSSLASSRSLHFPKTAQLLKELHHIMNLTEHKKVKVDGRKKTCAWCRQNQKKTASGRSVESSWMCNFCRICLCEVCFGPWHDANLKTMQLKNRLTSSQATSSPSHEDPGSSSRADAQSFLYSLANLSPHVSTSADAHRLTTNTISANSVAQRSSTSGLLVSYLNQISNSEPVNKHSIKSEVDNWAVMCQNNSLHDHTSDISGHNFSENTADLNSTHSYNTRRAQGTSWNREFTYNDSDDDDDDANSSADSFAAKTFMKTFDYKDYDENDDDGISTSNDDKDADYVPDEYEDDFKDS